MKGSRRLVEILDKECGCWKRVLRICGVVRGLIKKLFLALAKEVRSEVLADWVARSSISSARYSNEGA